VGWKDKHKDQDGEEVMEATPAGIEISDNREMSRGDIAYFAS
jgi:hypothetical protein